jgi:hypothetical protein
MKGPPQKGRVLNSKTQGAYAKPKDSGNASNRSSFPRKSERSELDSKLRAEAERVEGIFGFELIKDTTPRLGWLLNYLPTVSIAFNAGIAMIELKFKIYSITVPVLTFMIDSAR